MPMSNTKSIHTISKDAGLWSVEDVAQFLKLTPKGIYSLVSQRRIPFIKVSNRLRFVPGDVIRLLEQQRVEPLQRR